MLAITPQLAGIYAKEKLDALGVNEDVSFVAGGVISVASTPVALTVADGVKAVEVGNKGIDAAKQGWSAKE